MSTLCKYHAMPRMYTTRQEEVKMRHKDTMKMDFEEIKRATMFYKCNVV